MRLSGAIVLLGLLLNMAQCGERDSSLDEAFALTGEITPDSFQLLSQTSERADAISIYETPPVIDPVKALSIPSRFHKDDNLQWTKRWDRADSMRTLASWEGPSRDGESTCALILRVPESSSREVVEIVATCALGQE